MRFRELCFSAPAVTCHDMMDRTADADNFSAHRQGLIIDLCAEGGGADTDEVGESQSWSVTLT